MKFCPECGTPITHQGSFCQECGTKLPHFLTERFITKTSDPISHSPAKHTDGFGMVHKTSLNKSVSSYGSLVRSGMIKMSCNFGNEEFDILLAVFEEMDSFLKEMKKRYGPEYYDDLISEFDEDTYTYLKEAALLIENCSFPVAYNNFLPNVRNFFQRAIVGLKDMHDENYSKNIVTFSLFLRIIDIINSGNYNKEYLYNVLPDNEHLDIISPDTLTGWSGAHQPDSISFVNEESNRTLEEEAPDFKDQIAALEKDLSSHTPSLRINEYDPTIDYEAEIDKLIGLSSLKLQLKNFIDNFKIQLERQKLHPELKNVASFNCVFKGKPGTGKTTVARLIAGLLRQKGIVKGGRSVEVDASSLVSGWIGFSAKVTTLAAYKAMDGVLFIDEAYAIMNNFESSNGSGPGKDVIDALTPIMENYRDRLIIIIAGYDQEMEAFLKESNTGFPSRFKSVMQFEDYNADEMTEIFKKMLAEDFYVVGEEAIRRIHYLFDYIYRAIPSLPTFANARTVRNVFDQVKQRSSQRMLNNPDCDYDTLTIEDVTLTESEIKIALGII